jgi:hypothetical protein
VTFDFETERNDLMLPTKLLRLDVDKTINQSIERNSMPNDQKIIKN